MRKDIKIRDLNPFWVLSIIGAFIGLAGWGLRVHNANALWFISCVYMYMSPVLKVNTIQK